MQNQIKQVWRDVREWEEVAHNMWGEIENKKQAINVAIGFTSDHKLYGYYMKRVAREWPVSCQNALTDPHMNHKAWIGHAAVALAHNIPEDITRIAWGFLTDEQKYLANKEAEREVAAWRKCYFEDNRLHSLMAGEMLF